MTMRRSLHEMRCRPITAWALSVISCLSSIKNCDGGCLPNFPTIPEQFALSSIVARINLTSLTTSIGCDLEIRDDVLGYIEVSTGFPMYDIIELFKGNFTDNQTIPVIYSTDTGFLLQMPTFLTNDTEGLLAFIDGGGTCLYNDSAPLPYVISECIFATAAWSDVSPSDQDFLRSQAAGSVAPISIPTTSDSPSSSPSTTQTSSSPSLVSSTNPSSLSSLAPSQPVVTATPSMPPTSSPTAPLVTAAPSIAPGFSPSHRPSNPTPSSSPTDRPKAVSSPSSASAQQRETPTSQAVPTASLMGITGGFSWRIFLWTHVLVVLCWMVAVFL